MGPAVQGNDGDRHTYAVCKVGLGFDLSESEFSVLLLAWNGTCQPPWDERQLLAKLASTYRRSTKERGSLVKEARGEHDPSPPRQVRPLTYPPGHEVVDFWTHLRAVPQAPEVAAWLGTRGLAYDRLGQWPRLIIQAVGEHPVWPPWASCGDRPWYQTRYKAIIPLFDARGEMRSVKARAVADGDGPKSVPPIGYDVSRLVMASPTLAYVLRTGAWPDRVAPDQRVIYAAEGEPDYLSLVQAIATSKRPMAGVLGYFSGSFSFELFKRLPEGQTVIFYRQTDTAGAAYLDRLRETFRPVLLERRIDIREPKPRSS